MTPLLELKSLTKTFRSHWTYSIIPAVSDVSFAVQEGEAFGFLGHNGAGKTTTMKCILGLVHPNSGTILFNGQQFRRPQQRMNIGYLPELPYFYDHLTVVETLEFFCTLYSSDCEARKTKSVRQLVDDSIELVGLKEKRDATMRSLSKGLQQRVGFAQAILHKPKLLFLDEPFSGLDPLGRREFRTIMLDLKKQGTTLFLSSHILSDVEHICDRVAIMAKGTLRASFHLSEIAKKYGEKFEVTVGNLENHPTLKEKLLRGQNFVVETDAARGTTHRLTYPNYDAAKSALADILVSGAKVEDFRSVGASLEEIFMNITEQAKGANV